MKFTNKHGLPSVFETLLRKDRYSKGDAMFSVTELISPPRIRILREKHDSEIEKDVSDFLWPLVGKAVHRVLQDGATPGTIPEQRLYADVGGVTISGAIDLQVASDLEVKLSDFKFTSTWALMQDKREWEEQLNVYAYLCIANNRVPIELQVVAVLRDWSRAKADADPTYPQAPIQRVPIKLWSDDEAKAFVENRIKAHLDARYASDMGDTLPLCSNEERWMSPPRYAVMKKGRKRAVRVFDSALEATDYMASLPKVEGHSIEERVAEPIRCSRDYCNVAKWCDQYRKEKWND